MFFADDWEAVAKQREAELAKTVGSAAAREYFNGAADGYLNGLVNAFPDLPPAVYQMVGEMLASAFVDGANVAMKRTIQRNHTAAAERRRANGTSEKYKRIRAAWADRPEMAPSERIESTALACNVSVSTVKRAIASR